MAEGAVTKWGSTSGPLFSGLRSPHPLIRPRSQAAQVRALSPWQMSRRAEALLAGHVGWGPARSVTQLMGAREGRWVMKGEVS